MFKSVHSQLCFRVTIYSLINDITWWNSLHLSTYNCKVARRLRKGFYGSWGSVQKSQMDIPILISNFFPATCIPIKDGVDGFRFQYTTNIRNPTQQQTSHWCSIRRDSSWVLALHILLSKKLSLEKAHVPTMELGIRNWTHQSGC